MSELVNVRYIVNDVEAAIRFYTAQLGFRVDFHPAPGFARLAKGQLRLLLNSPGAGGAGQARDGAAPVPGGWNRIQLDVSNLADLVAGLRASGCRFRGDIVHGNGGDQILIEDPSGNLIELFEAHQRR